MADVCAERDRRADPAGGADPVRRVRRRARSTSRRRVLRRGPRRRAGRARLRHEPRGRPAVRRAGRARPRPLRGDELGEPDPFVVVEAGAGRGRLAADVLRAEPACAAALRYVLVERSAGAARRAARAARRSSRPRTRSARSCPATSDDRRRAGRRGWARSSRRSTSSPRCAFDRRRARQRAARQPPVPHRRARAPTAGTRSASRRGRRRVRRGARARGRRARAPTPTPSRRRDVPTGARLPVPSGARALAARLRDACCDRGALVVVDYVDDRSRSSSSAGPGGCAPTGSTSAATSPLEDAGAQDITADVPLEHVVHAAERVGLRARRGDDAGRVARATSGSTSSSRRPTATWDERAHVGDLEALAGRSRVAEARGAAPTRGPRRAPCARVPPGVTPRPSG